MKKFLKIVSKVVLIILGIIFLLLIGIVIFLIIASKQPQVPSGYYEKINTSYDLEQKYTNPGTYEVSFMEFDSNEEAYPTYRIWYPSELSTTDSTYPIVVMANGTGVPSSKYEAVFEHLASWGFVVIGNDDAESWAGTSSSKSLAFLLELNEKNDSEFYHKLDTSNIGIAGHSQGGVAAINAVTNFENSNMFTSIYTASTTQYQLSIALEWPYDVSKVNIPYFMVAGTKKTDAETITPLSSLEENFNLLDDSVFAIYARRSDADHGEMLAKADGYMTAWFCYTLQNDADASAVFTGENPEILDNTENWQDVHISPLLNE